MMVAANACAELMLAVTVVYQALWMIKINV
jgi:hypothetical protein